MSSNLEQFMQRFVHANEQRKQQPVKHAVPAKQNVLQVQKSDANFSTAMTKSTTFKLSEEQYRTSLIAKAIACINKYKGVF